MTLYYYNIIIQVNFTPSFVKSYSTALLVDIEEAGREVFSIPITARSTVPQVTLITQLLDYGRCFLRYPYTQNVEIMNDTALPVKYEMPPQVRDYICTCRNIIEVERTRYLLYSYAIIINNSSNTLSKLIVFKI
jgi:hypothetical protein